MGAWIWAADPPVVVADPPDWLDYLTAFGTVGAALVPLIFFLIERRGRQAAELARGAAEARRDNAEALQRETENRARAEELEHLRVSQARAKEKEAREQAELVHVWLDSISESAQIHILNFSNAPILYLTVSLMFCWQRSPGYEQDQSGDMSPLRFEDADFKLLHQLGPTGRTPRLFALPSTAVSEVDRESMGIDRLYSVDLVMYVFTDSKGQHWCRHGEYGLLNRYDLRDKQHRHDLFVPADDSW